MRAPKRLLPAACLCALAVAALPAAASADYHEPFKVSVKGKIEESWHTDQTDSGPCKPRTRSSGQASIRFATPVTPMRAYFYRGWRGKLVANVQATRSGSMTEQYTAPEEADFPGNCDPAPVVHGGDCGARSYRSPVELDYGDKPYTLGMSGDYSAFLGGPCLYAPDPVDPNSGGDFDTLELLRDFGPRTKAYPHIVFGGSNGKHVYCPKRRFSIHWKKRITRPLPHGEYVADVEYTAKYQRAGRMRKPPGC